MFNCTIVVFHPKESRSKSSAVVLRKVPLRQSLSKMSNRAWFNLHKFISEAHRLHSGHVFVGRRSACWEGCCLRAQGWQKTAVLCNCHRLWPHVHEAEQRRYFKLIFFIDVGSTWRKMFDLMGGLNRIFKFSLMMPNDPAVGPICGFFFRK